MQQEPSHHFTIDLTLVQAQVGVGQNSLELLRIDPLGIAVVLEGHDKLEQFLVVPFGLGIPDVLVEQLEVLLHNAPHETIVVPGFDHSEIELVADFQGCQLYLISILIPNLFHVLQVGLDFLSQLRVFGVAGELLKVLLFGELGPLLHQGLVVLPQLRVALLGQNEPGHSVVRSNIRHFSDMRMDEQVKEHDVLSLAQVQFLKPLDNLPLSFRILQPLCLLLLVLQLDPHDATTEFHDPLVRDRLDQPGILVEFLDHDQVLIDLGPRFAHLDVMAARYFGQGLPGYQGVTVNFPPLYALLRVHLQATLYEVYALRGNLLPVQFVVGLSCGHQLLDSVHIAGTERVVPIQDTVIHDTNGPDIRFKAIIESCQLLGGISEGRADIALGHVADADILGQPEVSDLAYAIMQQDIGGLEIPMHDACLMQTLEPVQHLLQHHYALFLLRLVDLQVVLQVSAIAELSDYEKELARFEGVDVFYHVFVVYLTQNGNLGQGLLLYVLIGRWVHQHYFHCHLFLVADINALDDYPELPLPKCTGFEFKGFQLLADEILQHGQFYFQSIISNQTSLNSTGKLSKHLLFEYKSFFPNYKISFAFLFFMKLESKKQIKIQSALDSLAKYPERPETGKQKQSYHS